jgi:TRAP-type C4-dicarboxylate transport system permease large subunit
LNPFVRNVLILAAVAAAVIVLNLEVALITVGVLLRIAFVLAIAFVAYALWRDFGRREMSTWPARAQWVVYGAAALLVVDIGWLFLGGLSGRDALAFILVAAACVFAGWRTWRDQQRYV